MSRFGSKDNNRAVYVTGINSELENDKSGGVRNIDVILKKESKKLQIGRTQYRTHLNLHVAV